MEIALLSQNSLRIKSKAASIGINPDSKNSQFNAIIIIGDEAGGTRVFTNDGVLIIDGPGEYEVAGIKISGVRNKSETVYSMNIDGVDVIVGTVSALSDSQQKIKEHNIVCIATTVNADASFATSIASHAVIFFGAMADQVVHTFAKENVKKLPKYQTTLDKLPSEMETVLLASSN